MTSDIKFEVEKMREKRKAKQEAATHEQTTIAQIGKWTLWCITAVGIFVSIWIFLAKNTIL